MTPFFALNDILAIAAVLALAIGLSGPPGLGWIGVLAPGVFLPILRERGVKVKTAGFLATAAVAALGCLGFLAPEIPWLPHPGAPLASPAFILWCLAMAVGIAGSQRPVECWKTIFCEYAGVALLTWSYRTNGGLLPHDTKQLVSAAYMFPMGAGVALVILAQLFHVPDAGGAKGTLRGKAGDRSPVVSLGGIDWGLRDFVRGWLITGVTGSGKTVAAIKTMMIQIFRNRPDWGGCVVDEKGSFHEIVREIAVAQGKADKIVVLQVRPEGAPAQWRPKNRYNILSYPGLPAPTYAKLIADTAAAVTGKGEEKAFFKTQALAQMSAGIALLELIAKLENVPRESCVRLDRLYETISSPVEARRAVERVSHAIHARYREQVERLFRYLPKPVQETVTQQVDAAYANIQEANEKRGRQMAVFDPTLRSESRTYGQPLFHPLLVEAVVNETNQPTAQPFMRRMLPPADLELLTQYHKVASHFNDKFLSQPPDQLGGVTSTIDNYLRFFQAPAIAETFCTDRNTVDFCDIDKGVIFVISMPQVYAVERQYLNTIFKLLFYTHALRRFDQPPDVRATNNLLIFWADEAQGVVTASDGGMEDYSVVDKTREAMATVVFATQSSTSFLPKLDDKKTEVLMLNLANRVFFGCADERGAELAAKTIGKTRQKYQDGVSHGRGGSSVQYKFIDEYVFKPHELRALNKFEAIVNHCEKGALRTYIPPVEADGSTCSWFCKGQGV
jgi:hypothetical protein